MLKILNNHIHLRQMMYSLLISVFVFFVLYIPFVFAQDPAASAEVTTGNGMVDAAIEIFGGLVYPLAHTIGSMILGIGGMALDMAIRYLIIGMGEMLNTGYGNNLKQIWEIIRDVFNLAFIFSFIFLGIKTILNAEDSGTKRALGHLIVAALFINFSLFIALAVIDFSNIMATQIYNQIIYVGISGTDNDAALINMNGSIAGAFVEAASIGSFFGPDSAEVRGMNLVFYSIYMMIFFIIAGIIFLFATYHVVYRFVALSLCIIFSPVLFLGLILPNFKKFSDQWLQSLLRQSFFAPAFMFLLYVSLQVLTTLKGRFGGTEGEGFTTILKGAEMTTDGFSILFFFALTIGFLYASVKVGDTMGIAGAKTTLGAIGKTRQYVGNATFGLAAGIGRSSFGYFAHNISENDGLKDAASKRGPGGVLARRTLEATRMVGDASFDVRKVGGVGKKLGIGEGRKGGFKSQSEEIEKKEKAYAKELGEVGDDDNGVMILAKNKEKIEDTLKELKRKKENVTSPSIEAYDTELHNLKLEQTKIDPSNTQAIAENKAKILDVEKKLKDEQQKERENINQKIDSAEKEIKSTEEAIKREKNRRQIGTDADAAVAIATKEKYLKTKEQLDSLKKEYAKAVDKSKKVEIVEKIKEVNEERKKLAREAKEKEGSLGYAGVLEKRGFLTSAPFGRFASQNHDAGKAIRKQYEKAVKKTKEEAQTDSLKEAIEKSAKKD